MISLNKELQIIFPKSDQRQKVVTMSAMTFGLSIESLSHLLQTDTDQIYKDYVYDNTMAMNLLKRWRHISTTPDESEQKFMEFYLQLRQAYVSRDVDEFRSCLRKINDYNFQQFLEKHKSGNNLSDEDILVILKYQIKYSLSNSEISRICQISRDNYVSRVQKLLELYPEYHDDFEGLRNYHTNYYKNFKNRGG